MAQRKEHRAATRKRQPSTEGNLHGKHGNHLEKIFYDPSHDAGFSTPWRLWNASKKHVEQKEKISEFLRGQDTYTLHAPARRKFTRNKTYADVADDCWQCDLSDMQALKEDNDGFAYLLCVICVFSRFDWCIPIKNKTSNSIKNAFKVLFTKTERRCTRLVGDKGSEFENNEFKRFLKGYGIEYYHTNNPDTKASICERFQRTIKTRLFKVFTQREKYRYIDGLLDQIVHAYNNTYHRTIRMTPTEASSPTRTLEVYNILYGKEETKKRPKLAVGDYVRISREKKHFEKGYTWNWSEEIFKVVKVIPHNNPCYKIQDLDGANIIGSFYEAELQKVAKPDLFKIAYIVKTKGKGDSRQHLVHWRGYPEKSRSWVFAKDLTAY
ncbi:hypothetical protein ONE63_011532 [Megalurothrips usitatus]|uniref:Integrase catalytic domain-containing protein n=1 Tax=Megalurothrips usitatus TaxID=439358 RepID=A0AAV7X5A3_9NEOP|nr:hypothetical protein ONE63_011532 [Megalurothrips usitatus]